MRARLFMVGEGSYNYGKEKKLEKNFVVLVWNRRYQCDWWFSIYINRYRNKYICNICSLALSTVRTRESSYPIVRSTPSAKILFLIPFFTERSQDSLEKWMIPGLQKRKDNMSLDSLTLQVRQLRHKEVNKFAQLTHLVKLLLNYMWMRQL